MQQLNSIFRALHLFLDPDRPIVPYHLMRRFRFCRQPGEDLAGDGEERLSISNPSSRFQRASSTLQDECGPFFIPPFKSVEKNWACQAPKRERFRREALASFLKIVRVGAFSWMRKDGQLLNHEIQFVIAGRAEKNDALP